ATRRIQHRNRCRDRLCALRRRRVRSVLALESPQPGAAAALLARPASPPRRARLSDRGSRLRPGGCGDNAPIAARGLVAAPNFAPNLTGTGSQSPPEKFELLFALREHAD